MRSRRLQLPAVSIGAAEYHIHTRRIARRAIGVRAVLAGVALLAAYRLFPGSGVSLMVGLLFFGLGRSLRRRRRWPASVLVGLGTGVAVAGSMSLLGTQAARAYWTAAGLFVLVGVLLVWSTVPAWRWFLYARSETARAGCRIGLFRPFHSKYSSQARSVLLPLLRGYGEAYFVVDESFEESEPGGLGRDYERFPRHASGHRYTKDEWQSRVYAEIQSLDVAVIDISIPSVSLVWEIKQCMDRLPPHRILFVASVESVFPPGLLPRYDQNRLHTALLSHIARINKGLQEMGSNPISSRCLVYWPDAEGTEWLANALFQSMYSIVITEFEDSPGPVPGSSSLHAAAAHLSIHDYFAANKERVRRMVEFEGFRFPLSIRTRSELIEVIGEVRRKHRASRKTPIVDVSVPVCRECWRLAKSRDGDTSQAVDVPAGDWQGGLMRYGLSESEVAAIDELLHGSHRYLFCHGACHRVLGYGRDDVFVMVARFDEYFSSLIRGMSGSQALKVRRWLRHLVFQAYSGHCFGCYVPVDLEAVKPGKGPSRAELEESMTLELLCRRCDDAKRAMVPEPDRILVHFPLWPGNRASW